MRGECQPEPPALSRPRRMAGAGNWYLLPDRSDLRGQIPLWRRGYRAAHARRRLARRPPLRSDRRHRVKRIWPRPGHRDRITTTKRGKVRSMTYPNGVATSASLISRPASAPDDQYRELPHGPDSFGEPTSWTSCPVDGQTQCTPVEKSPGVSRFEPFSLLAGRSNCSAEKALQDFWT